MFFIINVNYSNKNYYFIVDYFNGWNFVSNPDLIKTLAKIDFNISFIFDYCLGYIIFGIIKDFLFNYIID